MSKITWKKAALVIGDIILLYISLYLTLLIRYGSVQVTPDLWIRHVIPFSIVFFIWIVVFFINNLYTIQSTKNDIKFHSYLLQNLLINLAIGFSFFYLAPASFTSLTPFRVLIILSAIFAAMFLVWRHVFFMLTSSRRLMENVLLLGFNQDTAELIDELSRHPQLGYTVSAIVVSAESDSTGIPASIPVYRDLTALRSIIQKHDITTVVAVIQSRTHADIAHSLFETLSLGINYFPFTDFYEHLTGRVPLSSLEESWFLENLLKGEKRWFELAQRALDIVFSIFFGLISLVLIPFIILGIQISSRGPILFKQERVGKGGKSFNAIKFRTMIPDAEKNGAQWASANDPRVTPFGRFLRKSRLDEIPQFINILRGEMSFVGPRPERPEFVSLLSQSIPFYKERLLVKPGLSGWAQINFKYGESVKDAMSKLQYDLFYIKNRSFTLDVSIILKTIRTVVGASLGQ